MSFQLQNLCSPKMILEEDVIEELGCLPKNLKDIYSRIYEQMFTSKIGRISQLIVSRVFKWLLCAQRQLSTVELLVAVSVDAEGKTTKLSKQQILQMCCNFVILDEDMDVFRFTHLSVREYLESREEYSAALTHSLAAERCLAICLDNSAGYERAETTLTQENETFRTYATLHWALHCQMSGGYRHQGMLGQLFNRFVLRDLNMSPSFEEWTRSAAAFLKTMAWDDPLKARMESTLISAPNPFFAACVWGFQDLIECCLKSPKITLSSAYLRQGLRVACEYDQYSVVHLLLEKGAHAIKGADNKTTALHVTARKGNQKVASLLLKYGADVEARDQNWRTALHQASEAGSALIVPLLLEYKANVGAMDQDGWTPLHCAADEGHESIAKLLLKEGADLEAKDDDGCTALRLAAERGHKQMVQLLLDKEAVINAKDRLGWTALGNAVVNGHEGVVRLLLKRGANVDAKQGKHGPLHLAAERGNKTLLRLLLDHGIPIRTEDDAGKQALHWAAIQGNTATVKQLLEWGADVGAADKTGCTALHLAAAQGHEALALLLLENEANATAKDKNGKSPLHEAASRGQIWTARLLLTKGANVQAKDSNQIEALHVAAASGHEAFVQLLLENGAKFTSKDRDGKAVIHYAARAGKEAVVRLLLGIGADIYARDKIGRMPLHWAAVEGRDAVVSLLLEKSRGVNARERDGYGKTPLECAISRGHKATAELLKVQPKTRHAKPLISSFNGPTTLNTTAEVPKTEHAKTPISSFSGLTILNTTAEVPKTEYAKTLISSFSGPTILNATAEVPKTEHAVLYLPPNLRRLIMSVPQAKIRFSTEDDLSASNRLKSFVEIHTGTEWNWWPLKQRVLLLKENQVRIHWECVSITSY